ncbi:MAG: hypothetical protein Q6373_006635, partial [Candidatus Sigynarchaeota archaeon]
MQNSIGFSKKDCILKYISHQIPQPLSELGFSLIKSREQFLSNYSLHDGAIPFVISKYLQHNFLLYPVGVDLRNKEVIINNELPDFFAEKTMDNGSSDNITQFCFD